MYRALYRKWRPRTFEDVIGQDAIVTALKNQITAGRVGHAYLFTGTRGTGKTTCAKIFAKAVNCQERDGADPCGKCEICKGIDDGSNLDVQEIDAATNTSVDDVRELRDNTAFLPSICRYKVYIIDEVHMLSNSAFNALLKTMEEPPEHVIFILATTEIHKVPATVLSRCQRYDFARISPQDIAARLQYVAQQEEIALDEAAGLLIARLADGAMRDALSILDTCAGVSQTVDEALVRRMAGVTDRSYLFEISDAIAKQDAVAALTKVAQLRQQSVDMRRLCSELTAHYRNLMLSALPDGTALLTGVSPEEEAQYAARASQPQREAVRAIDAFGLAMEKMARGTDQRIELELAIFSLTQAPPAAPAIHQAPAATSASAGSGTKPFATMPFVAAPVAQAASVVQAASAPQAAAAPIESAPATPAENAPPVADSTELPPVLQPELAPAPAPVPSATPARQPATPDPAKKAPLPEPVKEIRPFTEWDAVMEILKERGGAFPAMLRGSRAFVEGRRVLIDCDDLFRSFMREKKENMEGVKDAIQQVTGVRYNIGPYVSTAQTQKDSTQSVPIEQALESMRSLGVDVVVNDK